jgi:hypothetical protein
VYSRAQTATENANLFYRVNGGAWLPFIISPIQFFYPSYAVSGSVINAQVGDNLDIAVQGLSSNDRSFGTGFGGPFNTYFGKATPYNYGIITSQITIYLNLATP